MCREGHKVTLRWVAAEGAESTERHCPALEISRCLHARFRITALVQQTCSLLERREPLPALTRRIVT